MHLLQDFGGFQDVIIVLLPLHDHQDAAGVLNFQEDFFGCDVPDGLDEFGSVGFGGVVDPGHGELDHLDLGFFALSSSVHEVGDHFK